MGLRKRWGLWKRRGDASFAGRAVLQRRNPDMSLTSTHTPTRANSSAASLPQHQHGFRSMERTNASRLFCPSSCSAGFRSNRSMGVEKNCARKTLRLSFFVPLRRNRKFQPAMAVSTGSEQPMSCRWLKEGRLA